MPVLPIFTRADLSRLSPGTRAERVHELFGRPSTWGHISSSSPDFVTLNTSYRTMGGMGPLPGGETGYVIFGVPRSDLGWLYRFGDEYALIQLTNWRVERVFFSRSVLAYDP